MSSLAEPGFEHTITASDSSEVVPKVADWLREETGVSDPAARQLAAVDPVLGDVIARVGPCVVSPVDEIDLFESLLRSIIYQQLHSTGQGSCAAP